MGAIRLFLALAVLQSHIRSHIFEPQNIHLGNKLALGVNGGYAVMFFFVISGFIMSYVLDDRYNRPGGTLSFYKARIIRIYPLWWICWIVAVILFGFGSKQLGLLDFATSFLLIGSDLISSFWLYPAPHTELYPIGLGLAWSLATELTFYAIAPFLLRSNVACIILLVASGLWREAVNMKFPLETTDVNIWNAWCYYFFPATVLFFMLGHLSRELYKRLPMPRWMGFAGIGVAALICFIQDATYNFENVNFYFAIILFSVSLPAVFAATKDSRLFNLLGDLSYPLYLTHGLLLIALTGPWAPFKQIMDAIIAASLSMGSGMWTRGVIIMGCVVVLALGVSVVTRFALEIPATRAMAWLMDHCGGIFGRRASVATIAESAVPG
jgi:peptidoglycan/LPS O-acetylase OafA/YrhL